MPPELKPIVDGLSRSIIEASWAGYSGQALDYSAAVAAMRKNRLFGVDLSNVLDWGRREAMQIAGEDLQGFADGVRSFVERAVKAGEALETFAGRVDDLSESLGVGPVAPWHVETIFRTNVLAAYSGGQWTAARELAAAGEIAAARYYAVVDERTRPTHLAMDGFWARIDDPIWDIWWPPNGWQCRCGIWLMTQADVDALGGWEAAPTPPAVSPDPGFEGNPGTGLWAIVGRHMA